MIVIGKVGSIVNQGAFLSYDQHGQIIKSNSADDWPFVDTEVHIEEVLRDDGTISSGKQLILQTLSGFMSIIILEMVTRLKTIASPVLLCLSASYLVTSSINLGITNMIVDYCEEV